MGIIFPPETNCTPQVSVPQERPCAQDVGGCGAWSPLSTAWYAVGGPGSKLSRCSFGPCPLVEADVSNKVACHKRLHALGRWGLCAGMRRGSAAGECGKIKIRLSGGKKHAGFLYRDPFTWRGQTSVKNLKILYYSTVFNLQTAVSMKHSFALWDASCDVSGCVARGEERKRNRGRPVHVPDLPAVRVQCGGLGAGPGQGYYVWSWRVNGVVWEGGGEGRYISLTTLGRRIQGDGSQNQTSILTIERAEWI